MEALAVPLGSGAHVAPKKAVAPGPVPWSSPADLGSALTSDAPVAPEGLGVAAVASAPASTLACHRCRTSAWECSLEQAFVTWACGGSGCGVRDAARVGAASWACGPGLDRKRSR